MWHLIGSLLYYGFIIALILVIIGHIIVFGYLYLSHNLGRYENPADYPATPLWRFVKNFFVEFFYMSSKFYMFPCKYMNLKYIPTTPSPNKIAILLVHGFTRGPADWLWFKRQLESLNYPIFTVTLRPTYAVIEELAVKCLKPKIEEIKAQTNCDQIILIGQSMGGLVSSYYSENLDEQNLVRTVITIVTPYHGSVISVSASGASSKQMSPGSAFTKELCAKLNKSHKQYYQVASQLDNLVIPWRSALLENTPPARQLILPYESHLGCIYSKVVIQKVKEWIKGA